MLTLARSRFADWDGWEGVGIRVEPLGAAPATPGSFSLIVVDCGALPTWEERQSLGRRVGGFWGTLSRLEERF